MIITSRFLNNPIKILEKNTSLFIFAPATLTPPTPKINLEPIENIGELGKSGLETIGKIGSYMADPVLLVSDLWNCIHYISYPILLGIAMFSLIMYMTGYKKFAKYVPSSLVIFTLIQAVGRF